MISSAQTKTASTIFGLPSNDVTMFLVVLIWGANFSITKLALSEIPPLAFAALRFASGGLLLWLMLRLREAPSPLPPGTFWKLVWVGIIGNTFYQIFFVLGLRITSAANAALIIATVPTMVALTSALLGIERLTRNISLGVLLAFAGVVLVVLARGLELSTETIIGDVLLLGCAVAWTIYTLGVRTLAGGLSPLRITTWTMITGVPGLVLASIPDLLRTDWARVSLGSWVGLSYSSLFSLVVAYVLWNQSVRVVGGNRTAIYGCVIPLIAALVAWPVLGEQPTWLQAAGATLIIGGVLLTRR